MRGRSMGASASDDGGLFSQYGWLMLPLMATFGLVVVVVLWGLVTANGLHRRSYRMVLVLGVWTRRPGIFLTAGMIAYGQSISEELRERWNEGTGAPWLFRLELLSFLAVPVGAVLYLVFFFSMGYEAPVVPWQDSIAASLGIYTPLGWFLGITLWFGAPVVLALARFAEAFAFTGVRDPEKAEDDSDVVSRFR